MTATQFFRWDWIFDRPDEIWTQLVEHLWLTFLAVGIGFLLSFPTAIASYRNRRVYAVATATSGVLYTIPSLALFGALIPITGLSFTTAEIGLVSYTLLILIRNIVEGLRGVSEDAREAARGMGYTDRQLLFRVEIPLALPAIIAGLRIATVTTIGLVTVTSVFGLGGFGHFIFLGLRLTFPTAVILGAVLSLVLAIATDWLLIALERWLSPWSRRPKAVAR